MLVLCASLTFQSQAAESLLTETAPDTALEGPLADSRPEPRLDRTRDWLADRIETFSGRLDSFLIERFFGDEILDDRIEGSRALISLHTRREFGGDVDYSLDARAKLVLPNTDERLKLLIQADDDSNYRLEQDPVRSVENASYATALRFILLESKKWNSDFDVGVRWNAPPNPFVRNRFRRQFKSGDWHSVLTQNFYYYSLDGFREKTDIYTDLNLSPSKVLRFAAAADYWRKNDYFGVNYNLTLYHWLKNSSMLAYSLGAEGDTSGGAVFQLYHAGVRYRRLVYKDWVFLEVNPRQEWHLDNEYHRQAVIMFRLEALIE